MRAPLFDVDAPKRTVSLTLNSDLYAQARELGVNMSQVSEQALIQEVGRRRAELLRAEIRQDLAVSDAYAAEHGSFGDMVREHRGLADSGEALDSDE